ncbi:uncharacterized protein LOC128547503 [Mercenaria mercenaria]|uniref:uncharacterized protein LOC128547503 n=1 Tax=Mercenaria mercenaria TaxID=6596 RepID=UPI00234EEF84|nr:uncharacterized protein LOC128547503 [Mercenaria mercenaria]
MLSLSTLYAENKIVDSKKVSGLKVLCLNSDFRIFLPEAYTRGTMPENTSHIPTPELARYVPYLQSIAGYLYQKLDCEIALLIGYNCPKALTPREIFAPDGDGPFAEKTDLGWGIVGVIGDCDVWKTDDTLDVIGMCNRILTYEVPEFASSAYEGHDNRSVQFCLKTKVKKVFNFERCLRMMKSAFVEQKYGEPISCEDRLFLDKMNEGVRVVNGRYEMSLPFSTSAMCLPDNRQMAVHRLNGLHKRLTHDSRYMSHYVDFMNGLIEKGHAERVPDTKIEGKRWYIPHHGVYHSQKPNKLRVVSDGSAKFKGKTLKGCLLSGPDLTNLLVGVLCRFRQESVAFMCNIEQMFYQFKVRPEERDFLRFLWFDNDKTMEAPVDYRMTVHLFGAKSSPGCSNFGLKRIASDLEGSFRADVSSSVRKSFYVVDGLKFVSGVSEAIDLIGRTQTMLSQAGVRLCKFISNCPEIVDSVKPEDRARDPERVSLIGDYRWREP